MSGEKENKDEEGFDLIKNFHPNDIPKPGEPDEPSKKLSREEKMLCKVSVYSLLIVYLLYWVIGDSVYQIGEKTVWYYSIYWILQAVILMAPAIVAIIAIARGKQITKNVKMLCGCIGAITLFILIILVRPKIENVIQMTNGKTETIELYYCHVDHSNIRHAPLNETDKLSGLYKIEEDANAGSNVLTFAISGNVGDKCEKYEGKTVVIEYYPSSKLIKCIEEK